MTEQTPTSTTAAPREPRRRRRIRPRTFFALLGPGLIAANAGNDAGGIATYASAGSQFVYRTLFVMLLVTVALVGQNRGDVAPLADYLLVIDDPHYGRVEDAQMNILHMICYCIMEISDDTSGAAPPTASRTFAGESESPIA